jgi:2-iminobutanoate/2-iminopropanoate deaminase
MKNIEAILRAANAKLNDVVKVTIYMTDISYLPEINAAYMTYFNDPMPAREAVCVRALPLGATIEISVIAAK